MHYTVMPRLPLTPDFPVYGLSDEFGGMRWLRSWHPRSTPISAFASEPLWGVGLGHGPENDPDELTVTTMHGSRRDPEEDLSEWQTGAVDIGGVTYPSRSERHGSTLVETPTGLVHVVGDLSGDGRSRALVEVSSRLDEYVRSRRLLADEEHRNAVRQFRTGRDRMWSPLRALVRQRGVQLNRAVLADYFWDLPEYDHRDLDRQFMLLVSGDRRVFQFVYGTAWPGEEPRYELDEWTEITTNWQEHEQFHAQIQWALAFIDDEEHRQAGQNSSG